MKKISIDAVLILFVFFFLAGQIPSFYNQMASLGYSFLNITWQDSFLNQAPLKWAFAPLLTLCVIGYLLIDLFLKSRKKKFILKVMIIFFLLCLTLFPLTLKEIFRRKTTQPWKHGHDGGVIQTELAVSLITRGVNPYGYDYSATYMRNWKGWEDNPGLYRCIYLPGNFYAHIPFKFLFEKTIGFYDARFLYLFFAFCLFFLILFFPLTDENKLLFLILTFFNPGAFLILVEGLNDFAVILFFVLTVFFLKKKNYALFALFYGISLAVKQFMWLSVPLIFIYFLKEKKLKYFAYSLGLFFVLIAPFLLRDFMVFIDNTVFYAMGRSEISYPLRAFESYGFSNWILFFKNISPYSNYSFFWWNFFIVYPLVLIILYSNYKKTNLSKTLSSYFFIFVLMTFFSRGLTLSYVYFGYVILLTAYFEDLCIYKLTR